MQKIKSLVYFENWVDPFAETLLSQRKDVECSRLHYAAPASLTREFLQRAHGYQISPRSELLGPWFGDAELLAQCPNLLAISSTGSGFDMIDVDACTEAGVIVCNQSGSNSGAVAEHALGMMLNLSRKISLSNRAMLSTEQLSRFDYTGNDLNGKVVGIVGIGTIGKRVASLCSAFGMQVLAFDPYLTEAQVSQRGALKVEFPELLRNSDFITLHCPRTPQTMNLFGAPEFSAMKPAAYFINTSRGGTYDEGALLSALEQEKIAGAGVDVFLEEPPPRNHPLLQSDAVIATPHIAGMTHESMRNMARFAAEQWLAIFDGAVPPRLVNRKAWPRYCERFERILGVRPEDC